MVLLGGGEDKPRERCANRWHCRERKETRLGSDEQETVQVVQAGGFWGGILATAAAGLAGMVQQIQLEDLGMAEQGQERGWTGCGRALG